MNKNVFKNHNNAICNIFAEFKRKPLMIISLIAFLMLAIATHINIDIGYPEVFNNISTFEWLLCICNTEKLEWLAYVINIYFPKTLIIFIILSWILVVLAVSTLKKISFSMKRFNNLIRTALLFRYIPFIYVIVDYFGARTTFNLCLIKEEVTDLTTSFRFNPIIGILLVFGCIGIISTFFNNSPDKEDN